MNFLLVMPNTLYDKAEYEFREYYQFALGICYISAAIKMIDDINVINLNMHHVDGDRRQGLAKVIEQNAVDVVLVGGICTLFPRIKEVLETAKSINPNIVTIAGGGIITGDPEAAMQALEYADYGIIGEGEVTVTELCTTLRDQGDPTKVTGLIIKKNDQLALTGARKEVSDLHELPWCDYDGFDFAAYLKQDADVTRESNSIWLTPLGINMLTSRSCPHRCTFCFHPEGKTYRTRKLDDVFAELDCLTAKYPLKIIAFVDELIGASYSRLRDFCTRIEKYNIPWTTSMRVNDVTSEKISMLKNANCQCVCFGVESGSDTILKSMRKGITVAQATQALEIAGKEQFCAEGNIIFGDPEETYETCMESLEWYIQHPQFNISLYQMQYYPGTEIYWRAVKEGKIKDRVQYQKDNIMGYNFTKMTSDEWNDIMHGKIQEYRLRRYKLLPEVLQSEIIVREKKILLTGKCSSCGNKLELHNLSLNAMLEPLVCRNCATLHSTSVLKNYARVRKNIARLLEKHGKLAFWGIGQAFKAIVEPDVVEDPRVFLVDRKSGGTFGDKPVFPLDTIARENIDVVILPPRMSDHPFNGRTVRNLFAEIAAEARSRYNVSHILDLTQLWLRDFVQD